MDKELLRNLRIDKRLHDRPDWIPQEELQRELDALPDLADKATRGDEEEARAPEPAPAPASEPSRTSFPLPDGLGGSGGPDSP